MTVVVIWVSISPLSNLASEVGGDQEGHVAWIAANVLTDTPLALGIRGQVRVDESVREVTHVISYLRL